MNIFNNSIYNFPKQYKPLINSTPSTNLGIVLVIPCFDEPDAFKAIQSLQACHLPAGEVEVIVIINASKNSTSQQKKQNADTYEKLLKSLSNNNNEKIKFYPFIFNELPKKDAGVGLARKIGMDEAWYRFYTIKKNGIIVCLDADCMVEQNYLTAIDEHFLKYHETPGASIYFEHLFEWMDNAVVEGIKNYELYLRYYINGLRYAGIPHAFQTIGSSFAVRSDIYAMQGGMNKRKAGEDFHFLHKIISLGNFSEINSTAVYPSCRPSYRVPFGTGKAIRDWVDCKKNVFYSYDPKIFDDLKLLTELIPEFYECYDDNLVVEIIENFPDVVKKYLNENHILEVIQEINENVNSKEVFIKRFYCWFNGLRVLQFIHFYQENLYKDVSLIEGSSILLNKLYINVEKSISIEVLLQMYRKLDINSMFYIKSYKTKKILNR